MSGKQYFEHDDRGPSTSKPNQQRQYFAMGGRHKRDKYRNSDFPGGGKRLVDLDGDVDMGGGAYQNFERRFTPYGPNNHKHSGGRRKSSKKNSGHVGNRQSRLNGDYDRGDGHVWFKVTIPHGKKSGKDFILKSITSLCKVAFTPYNFNLSQNSNTAEFYITGNVLASHIKDLNRRIKTPDGFKMAIFVANCASPNIMIDPEILEIIKNCMSACYDPERHSLNLMKFHQMDSLKLNGLYTPLNRPNIFKHVLKIIKENIPEIEILVLSDNKLYNLEAATCLVPVCKRLKTINLHKNKLRNITELNHLKGLDLEELVLDGNPLCDDYKDKTSYISAVRERFPRLKRLDGHELPAPIGFDLGSETLPASKKSFFAANEVKDLVIQFLDVYYSVYDSGDRSKLLDAYHDEASFSLCLSINTVKKTSQGSLGAYSFDNRNILSIRDSNERFKLLKQGKLGVVNALQELPQTMHDPSSFSVDIFHVSPGLMSFSVLGVFKEVGADINSATLKTFSRTFVVIPQAPAFVIVNETLFIAHASMEQQDKAFKLPAPTPSPSPAPPNDEKTANEKQLLVLELSKQTRMNLDFSAKCLEENEWDFQRSLAVFMKFQSEGKLPPEAFIPA